jgi:maltooligosyltrehalose synthase
VSQSLLSTAWIFSREALLHALHLRAAQARDLRLQLGHVLRATLLEIVKHQTGLILEERQIALRIACFRLARRTPIHEMMMVMQKERKKPASSKSMKEYKIQEGWRKREPTVAYQIFFTISSLVGLVSFGQTQKTDSLIETSLLWSARAKSRAETSTAMS